MGGLLYRWGRFCARRTGTVLTAWVLLVVVVIGAVAAIGDLTDDDVSLPGTDSQRAYDLLEEEFPPQQNGSSPIVFHAPDGSITTDEHKSAVESSVKAITKVPHVASATDPFANSAAGLVSKDGTAAFSPVLMDLASSELDEDEAQAVLDAAQPARDAGLVVEAGGPIGSTLAPIDTESSERVGLLAAMLILAVTFGSLVAMGLPIVTAVIGLAVGLGTVGLLGHVLQVPSVGPTLATMIGLGVGIDYALFLVSRHKSQLDDGMDVDESVARTVATSGSAVVFAGCTVVIALLSLAVASIPFVTSLGIASAVAVGTAVVSALTLLPAVLALLGHRVHALRLPSFLRPSPKPAAATIWGRLAHLVTNRPTAVTAVAALLLVPLIVPVASIALGQEDVGAEPTATTERRAFDLIEEKFGPGYNGVLVVANWLDPPATPSDEYTKQYDQATSMKSDLQKKQKSLTAQADDLTAQQAELEGEKSSLQEQQAELARQQSALLAEKAELERRKKKLDEQRKKLRKQARALRADAEDLRDDVEDQRADLRDDRRELEKNRAEQTAVEKAIEDAAGDPVVTERLEKRLETLQSAEAELEASIATTRESLSDDEATARELAAQARRLETRAEKLAREGEQLAKDAAALGLQAESLQSQASALTSEGSALQSEAATLTAEGDALKQQQKDAKKEQQQAESLQSQLTDELTRAGGDPRGTDPRLVTEQDALDALTTDDGVQVVGPPIINKSGSAAYFSVVPTTRPADPGTAALVGDLRDDVIPPVAEKEGLTVYVGGTTATNVDLASLISSRLPLVIVTVLALSFLLLMIAFRSLLVPLQAAVTNLLTVAAAFGVLTACFQWGWGIDLVGIETTQDSVPVASYVPLMMFAALFGLSMDYEVFLVSQVQHAHSQGASPREAVRQGLTSAAKVVAAAALIMISVFGSFVLNGSPTVKQFGVGLSVAVLLAGVMVLTFAPALLVVFGRGTFWLPRALDRVLPHMDVEGEQISDEPPPEGRSSTAPVGVGPSGS
jgi:uncharacterized membrane protein YdfJ with MMPL/SSD domain